MRLTHPTRWGFGPASEPPRVTGVDFVVVRDGKIAGLYTFLDKKA